MTTDKALAEGREAGIRECAAVVDTLGLEWMHKADMAAESDAFTRKDTKAAILALLDKPKPDQGDE